MSKLQEAIPLEEQPFLADSMGSSTRNQRKTTALPWNQLSILAYLILAEPIAFFVVFPYLPETVVRFGMAKDDRSAGYYAGLVESTCSFIVLVSRMALMDL